jgi:chromate transporter
MTLLRKLLKYPDAQAVLRGLKPCVVGIVLATGAYLIVRNCAGTSGSCVNVTATAMTALLAGIYFGSRKFWKGGLSPIGLIVLSALFGIIFYGFY